MEKTSIGPAKLTIVLDNDTTLVFQSVYAVSNYNIFKFQTSRGAKFIGPFLFDNKEERHVRAERIRQVIYQPTEKGL